MKQEEGICRSVIGGKKEQKDTKKDVSQQSQISASAFCLAFFSSEATIPLPSETDTCPLVWLGPGKS